MNGMSMMMNMGGMTDMGSLNGLEGGASVNFGGDERREARPLMRSSEVTRVRPFATVEAAIAAIESLDRELKKFELAVADSLQDYLGVQMAQITDCALARGWEPISFLQKEGFRLYRYETMRRYARRSRKP